MFCVYTLNCRRYKQELKTAKHLHFSKGLVCKYCHCRLYWATLLFVPSDQYFIRT